MSKINCYFFIATPIVTSLKGLMMSMLEEPNIFNVYITIYIKISTPETNEIKQNFNLPGLKHITVREFENATKSYIFVNTPYLGTYIRDVNFTKLLSTNKFLNVNYAYHIHKQLYHIIYNPEEFKHFYASFHECPENYKDYIQYMKKCNPKFNVNSAQLSGSTKVEYLKMLPANKTPFFKNNNKTILFSFRWEKTTNNYTGSEFVPYFINSIKNDTALNFIYRPHPLSKEKDLENLKAPNYLVDYANDYKQTFDTSNIFISDLSTLISDYFIYCKRPVILLNTNNKLEDILNSFGMKIIPGIYVVRNVAEIKSMLHSLLQGNDPKKGIREKIASELDVFSPNKFIKDFLKRDPK